MAAKGRALWIVLAIVATFASSPAFASIPRSTILDAPSIDFRDVEVIDTSVIDEAIDNAALLHHAIDTALIAPAPVESLSETRVWVSRLERPLFVEPVPLLSDGLQKASADVWPEIASGPTVLTPDPIGYVDSSNLYAFGAGDPVNKTDPTGQRIKLSTDDPWGDVYWIRKGLSNPAAGNLLSVTGNAKTGYYLGYAPGASRAEFIKQGLPDPPKHRSQMTALGIPMPQDKRTVEEKLADMISSPVVVDFTTAKTVEQKNDFPFWGTFTAPVTNWGGGVTLEPHESKDGNVVVRVDPEAIHSGSAGLAADRYGITYDEAGLVVMHELGHALAYTDGNERCFQSNSVFLENQIRARRGETRFRISENPLNLDPKNLICEPGQ